MFMIFAFAPATTTPFIHQAQYEQTTSSSTSRNISSSEVPEVPFYSQFKDISSAKWQKVGCGVTSLAMVIEYYKPDSVSVNTLLNQGVAAGAYLNNAGWTYKGLIQLSRKYGLDGESHDLGTSDKSTAFAQLKKHLVNGPVIVSVHYKFDPKSTIPHLVVINGMRDGEIYYNDPAAKSGNQHISTAAFLKAWKKRFIVIHPTVNDSATASTEAGRRRSIVDNPLRGARLTQWI